MTKAQKITYAKIEKKNWKYETNSKYQYIYKWY